MKFKFIKVNKNTHKSIFGACFGSEPLIFTYILFFFCSNASTKQANFKATSIAGLKSGGLEARSHLIHPVSAAS